MATPLLHFQSLSSPFLRETSFLLFLPDLANSRHTRSSWSPSLAHISYSSLRASTRNSLTLFPVAGRCSSRVSSYSKSTEEGWSEGEAIHTEGGSDDCRDNYNHSESRSPSAANSPVNTQRVSASSYDSISLGIREPVYEVVEVKPDGKVSTRKINRRHLLKSSGLRLRDIRSIDPSLWLTNSMPSLLVRERAILLNLGSLRAIAMQEHVFIFDYNRKGGKAFLASLLPRLNQKNTNGGPFMPFELEVVEAALISRIQRLEQRIMDVEPRVAALLEVLPNRLTADVLEQLRLSKQTLVELDSRAGALRQMLLDLLEDPDEIRRMCIMGRNCSLRKGSGDIECSVPIDKKRRKRLKCFWKIIFKERLLDSAKEMEDSIAVNLSSRRLEVSRLELLLQVGTFCVAVGALVAGIFGMNLKSYLEEHVYAFWLTTAGIIVGAVAAFYLLYSYLRIRKIL
ncbi:magnesium transporter MRS2-11, chloroplastic isoform X2 [Macadamia integrifolia]|uniref:magnesium transporter MRS2-11, chloroplastic isoform X2 n=1 Tax=Macadamia integrifolia TaxID=60698 RepID=UPI001C4F7881|nr:magnesium transporter MRS2-11, chloroplastic isoform X2 [Macadamia integrifolia]